MTDWTLRVPLTNSNAERSLKPHGALASPLGWKDSSSLLPSFCGQPAGVGGSYEPQGAPEDAVIAQVVFLCCPYGQ